MALQHKPVRIIDTFDIWGPFAEEAKTKEYMCKHGISKVRGAQYVQLELPVHVCSS